MEIKEFKVGQTCYRLAEETYNGHRTRKVVPLVVKRVGRKYVEAAKSLDSPYSTKYLNREKELGLPEKPYLTEVSELGYATKLFLTEQGAIDFVEQQKLYAEVEGTIRKSRSDDYSLDQLRRIKAVLDETKSNTI